MKPKLVINNSAKIRHQRAPEGECEYCDGLPPTQLMFPPHDASPRCESGGKPHCTCDTCF